VYVCVCICVFVVVCVCVCFVFLCVFVCVCVCFVFLCVFVCVMSVYHEGLFVCVCVAHVIVTHSSIIIIMFSPVFQSVSRHSTPIWDRNITGIGQVVAVGDIGIDHDMCFFKDEEHAVNISFSFPPHTESLNLTHIHIRTAQRYALTHTHTHTAVCSTS